jgi:hypothetical protein
MIRRVWRGVALGVAGTLIVVLGVLAARAAFQPSLTDADLAYCAAHADVVAHRWANQGAPGTIDPTADVALIAGYYRGDPAATLRLADHSYSGNSPGESARTDRIDGPLTDACRALTHP